ncbi:unnamed protein product [Rotaria sordida]|uniref:GP-PDE domain-containing protein n=1 Tax=Rotaria sordida TaxID=392033 RepID=A0A819PJZ5_9BILA|nr:unnamed protein product [Rotaria sordida]
MEGNIQFWIINGVTIALLVSSLFLIFSYAVVIFLIFIFPLTIYFLFNYFSVPQCRRSVNQFKNITIAHRGGQPLIPSDDNDFPENTMAAYRWASNINGIDCIELDVWLSRDHIPMVNHDAYLEHTFANCQQFISSLTCAELKQLKYLKKNKSDIYNQIGCEIISTLEEVIIFLEPTKLKLIIEIKELNKKDEMAKIINNLFERYPFLYDRAFCAAFHPYNIYAIRRLNPSIATGFISVPDITTLIILNAHHTPRPLPIFLIHNVILRWIIDSFFMLLATPTGLKFLGADIICIEHRQVSQNFLDKYKKAQIVVCAWCVNQPEQRQWLAANGVSVITDTLFDIIDKSYMIQNES